VGGARLLQRQGAGYRLLGGGVPEAHHAKGDHSGRSHLSPVVQQNPGSLAGAARIPGAGADSGLFNQVHGKGKSLYVPPQLIAKIQQRGGAARLKQCIEGIKAPSSRNFTRFLAKAISERQQTWPSRAAVKDGTAPKQLLEEWEEGKRLAKVNSPPPWRSPPTSPRPRKENRSQSKKEVQEQMERKGEVDYKAALEKGQGSAQTVDLGKTSMKQYLSPQKKPSAVDEKRQREVDVYGR
jgi:hypothetical protein